MTSIILGLIWASIWLKYDEINIQIIQISKWSIFVTPAIHMCSNVQGLRFGKICRGKSKDVFGLKVSYRSRCHFLVNLRWTSGFGAWTSPSLLKKFASGIFWAYWLFQAWLKGRNSNTIEAKCTARSSYDALTIISWFVSACGTTDGVWQWAILASSKTGYFTKIDQNWPFKWNMGKMMIICWNWRYPIFCPNHSYIWVAAMHCIYLGSHVRPHNLPPFVG